MQGLIWKNDLNMVQIDLIPRIGIKKPTNWFYESDGSYPTTSWFEKVWKIMDKDEHGKEKKRPTKSG